MTLLDEAYDGLCVYQLPSGEWGHQPHASLADRYRRVHRPEAGSSLGFFRKPNAYRTLTAMEVLASSSRSCRDEHLHRGMSWFRSQLRGGQFQEWAVTGYPYPDRPELPDVQLVSDPRHSAQAALALLQYDRNLAYSPSWIVELLGYQRTDGSWVGRAGRSDLLLLACAVDALQKWLQAQPVGSRDGPIQSRVSTAVDDSIAHLATLATKFGGLLQDEYQTAMVLERLGLYLSGDLRRQDLLTGMLDALKAREVDGVWVSRSSSRRGDTVQQYETTVRVAASLAPLTGFDPALEAVLSRSRDYLRPLFDPDRIDSSDYRYFVHIFRASDHLLVEPSCALARQGERRQVLLRLWLADALPRIGRLMEGRDIQLEDYEAAFLQSRSEIFGLMDALVVSARQESAVVSAIRRLLAWDDESALSEALRLDDRSRIELIHTAAAEISSSADDGDRRPVAADRRQVDALTSLLFQLSESCREQMLRREGAMKVSSTAAAQYREWQGRRRQTAAWLDRLKVAPADAAQMRSVATEANESLRVWFPDALALQDDFEGWLRGD